MLKSCSKISPKVAQKLLQIAKVALKIFYSCFAEIEEQQAGSVSVQQQRVVSVQLQFREDQAITLDSP